LAKYIVSEEERKFKMELNFVWLIVATFLCGWAFVFWFLKRVNEWYYVGRVGEMANSLPPGDMGWPFLGNMLSVMKCLRAGDPNSFINNLVSRSLSLKLSFQYVVLFERLQKSCMNA
jgi:hypothetical protein